MYDSISMSRKIELSSVEASSESAQCSVQDYVKRAADGDVAAFEALIGPYMQRVYAFALGFCRDTEEAMEISQEALIKAFRSIGSFRGDSSLSTWLYRISRNVFLDRKRAVKSRGRDRAVHVDGMEEIARSGSDPEQELIEQMENERVRDAVLELEPSHREVVLLVDMQGLSYREAADVLDIPVGTVKSRISRGHEALRDVFKAKCLLREK